MKNPIAKHLQVVLGLITAGLLLTSFAGCKATAPAEVSQATTTAGVTALTIVKDTQTKSYTLAELKALPSITGYAGQMSSTGNITGPNQYKGVAMSELLKAVGGITDQNAVRVSAKDGYSMTLSYKQVTEGNFTIIDAKTGKESPVQGTPVVFIAYELDSKPIDETVGPLRLGIMTNENQVTDGHWWVKWAQKIEIVTVQQSFDLKLEGAVSEDIDSATFESCSAIGCHGTKWTDDQGSVWEGVPLWYFVGKVDDTNTHLGDAYNTALADQGAYEVHILAADGTILKLTSKEVEKNNNMIVSFRRDGAALPTNQWPLRLVGSALDKSKQIGQITSIKLMFGAKTTTTTPATTDTGPVVLTVVNGTTTKTYTLAQVKALQAIFGDGATKNKTGAITGPFRYRGVTLTDLLASVGGISATQSVKVSAPDGFSKTLTYKQVTQGDFPVYDSAGNPATAVQQPVVVIVYEQAGAALADGVGPLEMAILTNNGQATDSSWWVKVTTKIEVINP